MLVLCVQVLVIDYEIIFGLNSWDSVSKKKDRRTDENIPRNRGIKKKLVTSEPMLNTAHMRATTSKTQKRRLTLSLSDIY
jgi:hypothetical protein